MLTVKKKKKKINKSRVHRTTSFRLFAPVWTFKARLKIEVFFLFFVFFLFLLLSTVFCLPPPPPPHPPFLSLSVLFFSFRRRTALPLKFSWLDLSHFSRDCGTSDEIWEWNSTYDDYLVSNYVFSLPVPLSKLF